MSPINKETARKIYQILVEDAGADDRQHEVDSFVWYVGQKDPCSSWEWRFCGKLGFGGKFYNNTWGWYISCYAENMTDETTAIMKLVNQKLKDLRNTPCDGA